MTTLTSDPLTPAPAGVRPNPPLEEAIRHWGERIFSLMDQARSPSLFSRKGLYGAMMDWSMKDEQFKTQLFRFVDVLPMLQSSSEVARHLKEYLDTDEVKLPTPLRAALMASGLFGGGIKSQVTGLARMFMVGSEEKEIVSTLKKLHHQGIGFTVDILGEAVVSEAEADEYAARYLELMEFLARETGSWPKPCPSDVTPRGVLPRLNVSIKISALYSQIHPADPDTAIARISSRLRPILRRARELGAFIHFDMESYGLKELTLRLFRTLFSEAEFASGPPCGLAMQAYLKDCEKDLQEMVAWARKQERRITIRLVKGAYWDYETILARQKGWPIPVFERKAETDANFEQLSLYLLENDQHVTAAFATHNVRSAATILAHAERLGVDPRHFEFQMLYGMADSIKSALLQLGLRLREYAPVGELLPGMAYLVRRLLENTSNEGFLANQYARGASRHELLKSPRQILLERAGAEKGDSTRSGFTNEAPVDFTRVQERERLQQALRQVRTRFGQKQPLIIHHKAVPTRDWLPSLNPANLSEIIGLAAQATVAEADQAVAAALEAQKKWARVPASDRAAMLHRTASLLRRDKTALTALIMLESGKSCTEADGDVAEAIDFCDFYGFEMSALGQPQPTQQVPGETNEQHWLPRGIGVVIAPWNFPLAILTGMVAAAVAGGNAVIMKPAEQTPIIAGRLMELWMEAGCPAGVINLLTGLGEVVGAHLVAHPKVDFIAFTGSREVGLQIWETAGRTLPGQAALKKVVCEMGGKNCLIIDGDADLDEALQGVMQSAFSYQGQKCSALSRLIVLEDHYQKVLERLTTAAASLRIGPPEELGAVVGPVISPEAQQRIMHVIDSGKKEAKLLWQGPVPSDKNACYVPPTLFSEVSPTSRLFREEIFGPVLCITRARNFEEALELANTSDFALTAGLYSRSPVNIERAKKELVCGNLYINRAITGALVGRQPFGGYKMSGTGTKAGGREYLQQFLLPRVVTENCLRRGFVPVERAS